VFLDCPPSLGLLTVNALTAASSVLIPIQCEYYALEGLSQLTSTINLVRDHLNPELAIKGVVLTMFDARTNLSTEVAAEVRRHLGSTVYKTVIPRSVRLSEAPSHGLPVALYRPDSKGADAYRDLATEFLRRDRREMEPARAGIARQTGLDIAAAAADPSATHPAGAGAATNPIAPSASQAIPVVVGAQAVER